MSTLNVANISDDQSTLSNGTNSSDVLNNTTTVDTKFVTNGCAKAWVFNYSGSGIQGSQNISSHTYHGTGDYSWGLTNAFVSNLQYVQSSVSHTSANNRTHNRNNVRCSDSILATEVGNYGTSSAVDSAVNLTAHGELA